MLLILYENKPNKEGKTQTLNKIWFEEYKLIQR